MFDDLHDPNQPEASMKTLADVTERARAMRRRRVAWIGAGAAVVVVAVTVGVFAATRDDDSKRITPLTPDDTTLPVVETTAGSSPTTELSDTTVPETSAPETSAAVVPNKIPATVASVADSIEPATTVAAATTGVPTTTTIAETTTPPVNTRPIAAIDANGDAVIVALDGTTTLLYDGPDPDDPPPTEGESYFIDAVAVTDDGSVAFVGTCCEPIVGNITRITPGNPPDPDGMFGHGPAISPDGTKLASAQLQAISLSDLNLHQIAATAEDFLGFGTENGIIWVDNQRIVVLTASPADAVTLQMVTIAAGNTLQAGLASDTTAPDPYAVRLAGSGPGVIYVHGVTPATLTAFDSTTLQPVPAGDITLPAEALSAWMQDGQLRWVDTDRHLHVGEAVVPGEYIWVR